MGHSVKRFSVVLGCTLLAATSSFVDAGLTAQTAILTVAGTAGMGAAAGDFRALQSSTDTTPSPTAHDHMDHDDDDDHSIGGMDSTDAPTPSPTVHDHEAHGGHTTQSPASSEEETMNGAVVAGGGATKALMACAFTGMVTLAVWTM